MRSPSALHVARGLRALLVAAISAPGLAQVQAPQSGTCINDYTLTPGVLTSWGGDCPGTLFTGNCILAPSDALAFCDASSDCGGVSETTNALFTGLQLVGKLPITADSEWTTCRKPLSCTNPYVHHNGYDSRLRYQALSVNAPAPCVNETQIRLCTDGTFSAWSGTYTFTACTVMARCTDPDMVNGGIDTRVRYANASANAPAQCLPETQNRTCNDGNFSEWDGTHLFDACVVRARCTNPDMVNGGIDVRVRYQASSVNAPEQCVPETQLRRCNDGTFAPWSGTFTFPNCTVQARCSNPDMVHGGTDYRIRYQAARVDHPAVCISEQQTRTCNNGVFPAWSGTYLYDSCSVDACLASVAGRLRLVDPACVTLDGRWYSLEDDWSDAACPGGAAACKMRCTHAGVLFNSAYGDSHGTGKEHTCIADTDLTVCADRETMYCVCSGTVYYGKKFVSGQPGSGTIASILHLMDSPYKTQIVPGSIACTSDAMGGDPTPGYHKQCLCHTGEDCTTSTCFTWQGRDWKSECLIPGGCSAADGAACGQCNRHSRCCCSCSTTPSECIAMGLCPR